ncbi:MAG: Omp28-related outer membrane protein [Bacteroidota bacterium]|nr:Omp28-related outer membrane protein [Bacteroidota bacterium]
MKSTLLSFFLLLSAGILFAQSPRKALVEHFTQASCAPCASVNPVIHPIMERNKSKMVRITHQVSWPGYDPMNKDNPGEIANRVSYYGVLGVPDAFMNGVSAGDPINLITDANIDAASSYSSPYELAIENGVRPNYNSIDIKINVKLTGNFTGRPVLRVVVQEKIIKWATAPGNNGEREFHHVVKKFIPNTTGTSLSDLLVTGESKEFNFTYDFNKLYDFKNLEVSAFIQDENDKSIFQAESAEVKYVASNGLDAAIKLGNATGRWTDSIICGTSTKPVISFINAGNIPISILKIKITANNGIPTYYEWKGSAAFLAEKTINLPEVAIPGMFSSGNKVQVEIESVNNGSDVNTINNIMDLPFVAAPFVPVNARFEMKPFSKPDLLTFTITNSLGLIILQDGPFPTNAAKSYDLNLNKDECYKINVTNNHTSLNSTFKMFDANGNLLFIGRSLLQGILVKEFSTADYLLAVKDFNSIDHIQISPIPVSDHPILEFESTKRVQVEISIMNLNGNNLHTSKIKVQPGLNFFPLDFADMLPGFYIVTLRNEDGLKSLKVIRQ